MKTLNSYISEGGFFDNVGVSNEEVKRNQVLEWLVNAGWIRKNDIDKLMITRNGDIVVSGDRNTLIHSMHDTLALSDRPDLFPDHKFPEFVKISNCPSVSIRECELDSVEDFPAAHGTIILSKNNLKSFEGCPFEVIQPRYGTMTSCMCAPENKLETLDGCPGCNEIIVDNNPHLTRIGKMNKKRTIKKLSFRNCDLRSLVGLPAGFANIESINLSGNKHLNIFDGNGIGKLLKNTNIINQLEIDADQLRGVDEKEWEKSLGHRCFIYKLNLYNCDDEFIQSPQFRDFMTAMPTYSRLKTQIRAEYGSNPCSDPAGIINDYKHIAPIKIVQG